MIRFENVSKHFRKGTEVIRALDAVSIEVPQGALALVRGPSGSGKTTVINLAAGLARPTAGRITIAGETLNDLPPRKRTALRAQRVALVFQMFHLVPYLNALENVLLPTLASPSDDPLDRAKRLLEDLGLSHRASHFPAELSAGERQRCAVARALFNRPSVILADEPTGNLDAESAAHVLQAFDVARADGATVFLVSHQHLDAITPDKEFSLKNGVLQA